jgi:hypothetical protein
MDMEDWQLRLRPGELEEFEEFELPEVSVAVVDDPPAGFETIEYWVWHDNELVPAPPNKVARIRELEALQRLAAWRAQEERARSRPRRLTQLGDYRRFREWIHAVVAHVLGKWAQPAGGRVLMSGSDARID